MVGTCGSCGKLFGKRRRCYSCEWALKWKPKPWLEKSGYLKVRLQGGRKLNYHRWIMEQQIGRTLKRTEIVHHRNENKLDNSMENLEIMELGDHIRHHWIGKKRLKGRWSFKHKQCLTCETTQIPHRANGLCIKCFFRAYSKKRREAVKSLE